MVFFASLEDLPEAARREFGVQSVRTLCRDRSGVDIQQVANRQGMVLLEHDRSVENTTLMFVVLNLAALWQGKRHDRMNKN